MSTEDNKAAIRRLFDGLNQKDMAVVDELCTPDFVLHDPGSPLPTGGVRSREAYKQFLSGFLAALPGDFTTDDMIAEGDKVVARWTYRGTHQGQWRGLSPTGNAVTFTATSTYRFVEGKLAESWQNVDNLGVLRQLGLLPAQG
jgi:predicted ester cyclase